MKVLIPILLFCAAFADAEEMVVLNAAAADTQKQEVRHSMMGFRDTLLFYTFTKQKAVLLINIANKDESFPVKGTLYLFDDNVDAEGLSKWLNNQHSDGLFPDVPTPKLTKFMPKDFASVTNQEKAGQSESPLGGIFDNYSVTVQVKDHDVDNSWKIKGFSVDTKVHIKR